MSNIIKCPHCHNSIDVSEALSHDLKESLTLQIKEEMSLQYNENLIKAKQIAQLEAEKSNSLIIQKLQETIQEQNQKMNDLNKIIIENSELKYQLENQKNILTLEANERFKTELERMSNEFKLQINEKEEQLKTLSNNLADAQQKAKQGSMQLQGESQETAIENFLSENFKYDNIIEIKKGQRGADCLQVVNTPLQQNCGKIYYESKRTKEFSPSWIDKFKSDMQEKGADIGVLVTNTYPKDMDRMGFYNGILICSFSEFKGVVAVLRESLIKINIAMNSQDNKSEKKEILYSYVVSNEFRLIVETLISSFTSMRNDLDSEKRSFAKVWTKREKQIEIAENSAIKMYGTFQGVLGTQLKDIDLLLA